MTGLSGPACVYKICTLLDWSRAQAAGLYEGSPQDRADGFVHLSGAEQVAGSLQRHFAQTRDCVLVEFEAAALGSALRYEPSRGGALFPHFYGILPLSAARRVWRLENGPDGAPIAPAGFEGERA